jgi:8-oxo-dGTP diphosphatase
VYEALLGEPINKVSFRRKMDELAILEPIVGAQAKGAHRPAQLYRLEPEFRRQLSTTTRALNPD